MDKFITKGFKVVNGHSASSFTNKITTAADVHTDVEGLEAPVTKKVKKETTSCMPKLPRYLCKFAEIWLFYALYLLKQCVGSRNINWSRVPYVFSTK